MADPAIHSELVCDTNAIRRTWRNVLILFRERKGNTGIATRVELGVGMGKILQSASVVGDIDTSCRCGSLVCLLYVELMFSPR